MRTGKHIRETIHNSNTCHKTMEYQHHANDAQKYFPCSFYNHRLIRTYGFLLCFKSIGKRVTVFGETTHRPLGFIKSLVNIDKCLMEHSHVTMQLNFASHDGAFPFVVNAADASKFIVLIIDLIGPLVLINLRGLIFGDCLLVFLCFF